MLMFAIFHHLNCLIVSYATDVNMQHVKINNFYGSRAEILFGGPRGSILGFRKHAFELV